jgi:phage/plasmid-like protein (TIGR03299 family)
VSKQKKSRDRTITQHATSVAPSDIHARTGRSQEAAFLGWQRTRSGNIFPLYNIVKKDHPSYLSTVTEDTLNALHLRTPRTPSPYPGVEPSPWHNLGIELDDPPTAREAIQSAGLDYTVIKAINLAGESEGWMTVRADTGDVLGIVEESYEPVQNRDAFTFFDRLVDTEEARYETAGALGHGERIWILTKLPGLIKVHGNDIVNKYLLLTNSHDGISGIRVTPTPIRVVCNNTLAAALQEPVDIHIGHTPAARGIEQALSVLAMANSLYDRLDVIYNRMALTKINDRQLLDYVRALVPDNEEGEDTVRTREIRNNVLALHESGQGSDLARGTLWGAYNSVTEYTDHLMADANPTRRLESIWFGRGEQLKRKAFQLAERMM